MTNGEQRREARGGQSLNRWRIRMTEFEKLKSELPRLRTLARSVQVEEAAGWSKQELAHLDNEIRWCVDALTELSEQVGAVTHQR